MEFTVRGEYQEVQRIHTDATPLHDPLLVTVLDFDRRALDQLAHGLHLTVIYTYKNASRINRNDFFNGNENRAVDPSKDQAGRDVYYLLKHIGYKKNLKLYASLFGQQEEDIKETIDFLEDDIRNQMAHQTYLGCTETSANGCELKKNQTTERCLEECSKLLQWIVHATFYRSIKGEVRKTLNNITNMTDVFKDFKKVKQSTRDRSYIDGYETDTDKAIDRLENLLEALREEQDLDYTIEDRPLTHFINMVVAPRLKEERTY